MDSKIVCYVTDDAYLPYAVISVCSLLRFNSGVTVCVFTGGLSSDNRSLLNKVVYSYGGVLLVFDVSSRLRSLSRLSCGYGLHRGFASLLPLVKLYIADYLPGNDSRVLYLDCDTLINGSLDFLFDGFDMRGRSLALAPDCMIRSYRKVINVPDDRPYFNCGVTLLDLARFRSSRFKSRFFGLLKLAPSLAFCEQDVINRFMQDDVACLPPHFNSLSAFQLYDYSGVRRVSGFVPFSAADFKIAVRSPSVIHFAGNSFARPWFKASVHPFRSLFLFNARMAGVAPRLVNLSGGFSFVYRIQHLLWRLLPRSLFNLVSSLFCRFHVFRCYGV